MDPWRASCLRRDRYGNRPQGRRPSRNNRCARVRGPACSDCSRRCRPFFERTGNGIYFGCGFFGRRCDCVDVARFASAWSGNWRFGRFRILQRLANRKAFSSCKWFGSERKAFTAVHAPVKLSFLRGTLARRAALRRIWITRLKAMIAAATAFFASIAFYVGRYASGSSMASAGDQAGDVAPFKSGVDVNDRHVCGATVQHAQQGGQSLKTRAVADAGGHGDHRAGDMSAHD